MELIEKRPLLPLWERGLLLIKLRWVAFATVALLYAITRLCCDAQEFVNLTPLAWIAGILGVGNMLFHFAHKQLSAIPRSAATHVYYRIVFFFEVSVDYMCVSILIFTYGFLYLNAAILYLPHVILSSIIFEKRKYSLFVAFGALAFIYAFSFIHQGEVVEHINHTVLKNVPVHGAIIFAAFNTGIVLFISYLTGLLVAVITHRKDELLGINQRLVELDREKQNYTLRATHELKAPFAAIQSYTQVILGGYVGEANPKLRAIIQKIDSRCESLSRLITHIIQLSNLRTTVYLKDDLQETPFNDFVQDRLDHYFKKHPGATATAQLETELDDDHCVSIVPNLFNILLDHLFDNAVRYSNNNARIWVSLKNSAGGKLKFSVKDFGIGIESDKLDKIFQEHYRTEEAAIRYPAGNGMGLAIVREVVRLHGAQIWVDSQVDEGTTFYLEL